MTEADYRRMVRKFGEEPARDAMQSYRSQGAVGGRANNGASWDQAYWLHKAIGGQVEDMFARIEKGGKYGKVFLSEDGRESLASWRSENGLTSPVGPFGGRGTFETIAEHHRQQEENTSPNVSPNKRISKGMTLDQALDASAATVASGKFKKESSTKNSSSGRLEKMSLNDALDASASSLLRKESRNGSAGMTLDYALNASSRTFKKVQQI
jgi:hypothetical protein